MRKIYFLFLFIAISANAFAQRSADFELVVSLLSNTAQFPKTPIQPNQLVVFDGKTTYYPGWIIKNHGPDTLLPNDIFYLKSAYGTIYKVFQSNLNPTLITAGDTIAMQPAPSGLAFNIPPGITPPLVVTKPWCDSIWIAAGPGNTPIIDPDMSNNYFCENIKAQYAWAVGINTVSHEEDGFLLYPNPANDKLNVRFDFADAKDITILLRNTIGQVVYRYAVDNSSGTFTHTIDVHELPPGMYTTELQYDGQGIISKLMIQ